MNILNEEKLLDLSHDHLHNILTLLLKKITIP